MLATDSITQGDTREVSLERLAADGWSIYRAVRSEAWPNDASLDIAKVWMSADPWSGLRILDGRQVAGILPSLVTQGRVQGVPSRLARSGSKSFQGMNAACMGFILTESEAQALIEADLRNSDVVKMFVNGSDLNENPRHESDRWTVDFADWPIERAQQYPGPFQVLYDRVRPEVVNKSGYPGWADRWWQYWNVRPGLRASSGLTERVIAIAVSSRLTMPVMADSSHVYNHKVVVFPAGDYWTFGLLASSFHWWWARARTGTLSTGSVPNYSPTDVFETFAQPLESRDNLNSVVEAARALESGRANLLVKREMGIAGLYRQYHDEGEQGADIDAVRALHVALDTKVRDAYGWSDLELDHHHWETPQGMRFTVGPAAKDELLDRLLELNHQRYAEEVAAGLHDKKSKKAPAKRAKAVDENQESML